MTTKEKIFIDSKDYCTDGEVNINAIREFLGDIYQKYVNDEKYKPFAEFNSGFYEFEKWLLFENHPDVFNKVALECGNESLYETAYRGHLGYIREEMLRERRFAEYKFYNHIDDDDYKNKWHNDTKLFFESMMVRCMAADLPSEHQSKDFVAHNRYYRGIYEMVLELVEAQYIRNTPYFPDLTHEDLAQCQIKTPKNDYTSDTAVPF